MSWDSLIEGLATCCPLKALEGWAAHTGIGRHLSPRVNASACLQARLGPVKDAEPREKGRLRGEGTQRHAAARRGGGCTASGQDIGGVSAGPSGVDKRTAGCASAVKQTTANGRARSLLKVDVHLGLRAGRSCLLLDHLLRRAGCRTGDGTRAPSLWRDGNALSLSGAHTAGAHASSLPACRGGRATHNPALSRVDQQDVLLGLRLSMRANLQNWACVGNPAMPYA